MRALLSHGLQGGRCDPLFLPFRSWSVQGLELAAEGGDTSYRAAIASIRKSAYWWASSGPCSTSGWHGQMDIGSTFCRARSVAAFLLFPRAETSAIARAVLAGHLAAADARVGAAQQAAQQDRNAGPLLRLLLDAVLAPLPGSAPHKRQSQEPPLPAESIFPLVASLLVALDDHHPGPLPAEEASQLPDLGACASGVLRLLLLVPEEPSGETRDLLVLLLVRLLELAVLTPKVLRAAAEAAFLGSGDIWRMIEARAAAWPVESRVLLAWALAMLADRTKAGRGLAASQRAPLVDFARAAVAALLATTAPTHSLLLAERAVGLLPFFGAERPIDPEQTPLVHRLYWAARASGHHTRFFESICTPKQAAACRTLVLRWGLGPGVESKLPPVLATSFPVGPALLLLERVFSGPAPPVESLEALRGLLASGKATLPLLLLLVESLSPGRRLSDFRLHWDVPLSRKLEAEGGADDSEPLGTYFLR